MRPYRVRDIRSSTALTSYSEYSLGFPGYGLREVTTYFDMITISFQKSSFLLSLDDYTQGPFF